MHVVATEKCKTYYGMVCIDIAEGDEFDGGFAEFLFHGGAPVRVLDGELESAPPDSSQEAEPEQLADALDIEGTAKHVLTWVGDDRERAAQARDTEQARDKPRSTLIKSLDDIINA